MPLMNSYNEETIRALAHQRWIDEGKPEGRADIHWEWALASITASAVRPSKVEPALTSDITSSVGIGPKFAKQLITAASPKTDKAKTNKLKK